MRVLVVEDDQTLAGLIETVARSKGHDVVVFDSVAGVMSAIQHPCTLLVDLTLIEGDGASLVRSIKSNPGTADAKVILLSGNREIEEIARECGADGWLRKPFGLADLEQELRGDKEVKSQER